MNKKKEIPEDIQVLLKSVCDQFDKEDPYVRERQIRLYKKLKLYWNGFQRVWWSDVAHDWRVWDGVFSNEDNDASYYDKPVNIFRAYLESIIAALSINVPNVRCIPDDANNPLDISTAKAGNKIYELVSKHNNTPLLWLESLFIYCTEGLVHCYSYPKEDEKYGTYEEPKYEDSEIQALVCPVCQVQLPDNILMMEEQDEFMPDDDDVLLHNTIEKEGPTCPSCAAVLDPTLQKSKLIVTRLVGTTSKPKSRQCIEVYGGLFVRTPTYAKKQEDMPYLRFSYETHFSNVLERWDHLRDKLDRDAKPSGSGYDSYERWGRLNTQYQGTFPNDMITVNHWWLRPSSFNVLAEKDAKELKNRFPDGCKVTFANDMFADAENECLDDCWTLTKNPMSDYLQFDPLGLLLVSIQDITNDLVALTMQTIEQGISSNWADPTVMDFDAYRQSEATPGSFYPTKPVTGKNVSESFYQTKAASLSPEVLPFGTNIQSLGQLTSGALPSLFGGEASAGSKTASEYAMSRSQALQRLQNTWKMFNYWWKDIFGKVIPSYIKEMSDDERLVSQDSAGNYINTYIRKAEVQGKIGDVELDSSEQLPLTWAQKRDILKEMMALQIPEVLEAFADPENLPWVKEVLGLDDFVLPGENDRQKQYEEIQQLMESEPIENVQTQLDPMSGQAIQVPDQQPSVEIDPLLDNHEVEASICRYWLTSEVGRQAKIDNPSGYMNVLLHLKQHMMILQQQMMQQQAMMAAQQPANGNSNTNPQSSGKGKLKMPTKQVSAQAGEGDGSQNRVQ